MRILIVEDDPKINQFLLTSLQAEQHAVDTAFTAADGLNLALQNPYKVIILDHLLPDSDGVTVCTTLRGAQIHAHIIGLSVQADTNTKVRFLDAGADDYMTKPFSFTELTARIRALSRRNPTVSQTVLTAGDIELDTRKHSVTYKGKPVHLTRKEFMLLEYLLSNRGGVVSRGMILEHVWDMNSDPFSNTIETHIMMLRQKVDPKKATRIIKTVAGVGYKIE